MPIAIANTCDGGSCAPPIPLCDGGPCETPTGCDDDAGSCPMPSPCGSVACMPSPPACDGGSCAPIQNGCTMNGTSQKRLAMYLMVEDPSLNLPLATQNEAILRFMNAAGSAGIAVGIQFYGTSCDPTSYASPRVPIALLPDNAAALAAALPAYVGAEAAATLPAMQGAQMHAEQWAKEHPDFDVVVVTVTTQLNDSRSCNSLFTDVIAAQQSSPVRTFIIVNGVPGVLSAISTDWADDIRLANPTIADELFSALQEVHGLVCK